MTMQHRPKHKRPNDEKPADYMLAESEDFAAFLNREPVPLRGRRHKLGAETVIRCHENRERASRSLTDGRVAA